MFEKSTSDARADDAPDHRCVAGPACRNTTRDDDNHRQPALTTTPNTLCDTCTKNVTWAIDDLPTMWIALHAAIGDHTSHQNQRVSASRTAPINLNTDVDALKMSIVEWLTAAAAPIAEQLNIDDPNPRNNSDTEHARIVDTCSRIIGPHLHQLIALPELDVNIWLTGRETEHPGEYYRDTHGHWQGRAEREMTGADIALKLAHLHSQARTLLAITTPREKMSLPCPYCNEYELVRSHRTINLVSGKTKEIDQIDCGGCNLSWSYNQYQQLIHIWVTEDEMEREKLQKKLDDEIKRRELLEWLLAKLEWKLGLVNEFPDVRAEDFVTLVFDQADDDVYMTDKDIAIYLQVSESTVRSWATRGHITRHTADDGSTLFLACQVWDHYKATHQPVDCREPATAT